MLQVFRAFKGRMVVPTRSFFTTSKKPVEGVVEEATSTNASADQSTKAEANEEKVAQEPSEEELIQIRDVAEKIAEIEAKIATANLDAEQATKRYHQQQDDLAKYAISKFARETLDIADNLKRVALSVTPEQIEENAALNSVITAVKGSITNITAFYKKFGIREEDPVGKAFDPNLHEAMFEVPLPHQANGTVAHVIQTGYLIHDRVLRPARVGVVRN